METSTLCRHNDFYGVRNLRCAHILAAPRGETDPRQCRRAAKAGTVMCDAHTSGIPKPERGHEPR